MKKILLLVVLAVLGFVAYNTWFSGNSNGELSQLKISELAEAGVQQDSLSAQHLSEEDLPPEGSRSLFDHLIKTNGVLPYPFEDLIDLVASHDADGKKPVTVMIPNGRSLLKGDADFARPRILVAANIREPESDFSFDTLYQGRLFLGFVEDANEIEVVSYNEQAGRFEFQLVKDYGPDLNPKIVYAKRAICTTCHQSGGPIFPVRPWDETNANPGVAELIKGHNPSGEYANTPVSVPLVNPETFDDMTDKGNAVVTLQRMWLDGCGNTESSGQCRQQMLKQALLYKWSPGSFDDNSDGVKALIALQREHWPEQGIALDDNDLTNRNPLTEKPVGNPMWLFLKDLLGKGETAATLSEKSEAMGLTEFESLPPLRIEVDPLALRSPKAIYTADTRESIYSLAQMFTDNDIRLLEKHSQYQWANLVSAIEGLEANLFGLAPFLRIETMQGLLKNLGVEQLPESCCHTDEGMSAPLVDGAPPLEISDGSVLQTFDTYCFACHRGNPNAKLDFMNGKTEAEVLERIKSTSAIADVLDYERYQGTDKAGKLMPPANSRHRKKLQQAIEQGQDPLTEMRDTIPSMFDF